MKTRTPTNFFLYYPAFQISPSKLWKGLLEFWEREGGVPVKWRLARPIEARTGPVDLEKVSSLLANLSTDQFHLEAEIARQKLVHFAATRERVAGCEEAGYLLAMLPPFTTIEDSDSVRIPNDWSECVSRFCSVQPSYGGQQTNRLYSTWQNTSSALEYTQRFWEIPPAFPRNSSTSPAGTSQNEELLNTELNPGRNILAPGYRFRAVAADLWLGPHFWDYAPCTKEEVLAADFFLEKRDTPHYLYLKSWPHPFTRPDGEQGRVQQKLWRLLFHEDCEWPPGSGGISDEPVGGPPELMP